MILRHDTDKRCTFCQKEGWDEDHEDGCSVMLAATAIETEERLAKEFSV